MIDLINCKIKQLFKDSIEQIGPLLCSERYIYGYS